MLIKEQRRGRVEDKGTTKDANHFVKPVRESGPLAHSHGHRPFYPLPEGRPR